LTPPEINRSTSREADPRLDPTKGLIAWFTRNHVAANLLMAFIIIVGTWSLLKVKKEAQPSFPQNSININVPFPGAAPEEVEQGILIRLESALTDVEGIETLDTFADEGSGRASIRVAVNAGYDIAEVQAAVEQAVSGISRFPSEVEKPIVTRQTFKRQVLRVQIYGNLSERAMKGLAEEVRDEMLALPEIGMAQISGVRATEIAVEIPARQLRRYDLTLGQVAQAIRASSIDLAAGAIESASGDIRIRSMGQVYWGEDFEQIVLLTRADGTRLTVGDIATVRDDFVDDPFHAMYNGQQSVGVEVFAVGDQSELAVSEVARKYVADKRTKLPPGVQMDYWGDVSVFLNESLSLMTNNLLMGAGLVFVILSIFLRIKLAFWVMVGIPVSFLGAAMMMPIPGFDLTINMMSIFGFFIVLGIVVDDAIIIGESSYTEVEKFGQSVDNVIIGAKRVAIPATFGVLTTIATFGPMIFSTAEFASMSRVIGWVVVFCLIFSIVESKLILPAHLARLKPEAPKFWLTRTIVAAQDAIAGALARFIQGVYRPFLVRAIEHRYTTVAVFIALLILVSGLLLGGSIRFVFSPEIPDRYAQAEVELADGVPISMGVAIAQQLQDTLYQASREITEDLQLEENLVGDNMTVLSNNRIQAAAVLVQNADGDINPKVLTNRWRELMGDVAGTKSMRIRSMTRSGGGPALSFKLMSRTTEDVEAAAAELVTHLRGYSGVFEVESSHSSGTRELQLRIKPAAESLGLTQADLASQVRQAFYGAEAQRIHRDRNEIKVMVRYPKDERQSIGNLEDMWLRTPAGGEVPLERVASIYYDNAPQGIRRQDGERVIIVSSNLDTTQTQPSTVIAGVNENFARHLEQNYPGVRFAATGATERESEALIDFARSFTIALFAIYALMAIPLRSYLQPLIVMSVIPFGLIGALMGHLILGYPVSSVSILGFIALTGVVVNDGIILVDFVNKAVEQGMERGKAAVEAGVARFRAILLTSLTTFFGLSPMLAETSFQAALMMPMAIALAFGILFATTMTLILIPCVYVIMDDATALTRRLLRGTESIQT